jgi:hypothetical protein
MIAIFIRRFVLQFVGQVKPLGVGGHHDIKDHEVRQFGLQGG